VARAATSEKFGGGAEVTFGNDYDVMDVQSPWCDLSAMISLPTVVNPFQSGGGHKCTSKTLWKIFFHKAIYFNNAPNTDCVA